MMGDSYVETIRWFKKRWPNNTESTGASIYVVCDTSPVNGCADKISLEASVVWAHCFHTSIVDL